MANNYCESSTFIDIPAPLHHEAGMIATRIAGECEVEDGCFDVQTEMRPEGLLLTGEEYFNTSHAERLVRALVEELDLPDPIVVTWAFWCSKPRPGEFGGGGFLVRKGKNTVWTDAENTLRNLIDIKQP